MFLSPLYVPFCLLGAGGLPRCLYLTDQSLLITPLLARLQAGEYVASGVGRWRQGPAAPPSSGARKRAHPSWGNATDLPRHTRAGRRHCSARGGDIR